MKIIVFGAGVLGSLYAARLQEAGNNVTLVARGKRYEDLTEHGIVLEEAASRERTVTTLRLLDEFPEDEYFDICLVLVQNTQLDTVLPILSKNPHIASFLFMMNYILDLDQMIDAVGRERTMLGHVNAGGERDGYTVTYVTHGKVTLGEIDGGKSELLLRTARALRQAGFPVTISPNMDAWKRHHMALLTPMCNAMYLCGTCNYQLAKNRDAVRKSIKGSREAMRVLQKLGFPVHPPKLKSLFVLPLFILVPLLQKALGSQVMDIGGARHARAAREEMRKFSEELISLADQAGMKALNMRKLHQDSSAVG